MLYFVESSSEDRKVEKIPTTGRVQYPPPIRTPTLTTRMPCHAILHHLPLFSHLFSPIPLLPSFSSYPSSPIPLLPPQRNALTISLKRRTSRPPSRNDLWCTSGASTLTYSILLWPCLTLPCHVLPYPALPCPILSCPVLSCHVMSYIIYHTFCVTVPSNSPILSYKEGRILYWCRYCGPCLYLPPSFTPFLTSCV